MLASKRADSAFQTLRGRNPPVVRSSHRRAAPHFHAAAPSEEWLRCDAAAPVGRDGLLGCNGRLWSPDGRLVASGTSTLFCRPSDVVEPQRARRHPEPDEPCSASGSM